MKPRAVLLQDYVGEDVNVGNFFAVLLGNKTALTGGSGKVVDSSRNDHIFVFYTDHGGPGILGQYLKISILIYKLLFFLGRKFH